MFKVLIPTAGAPDFLNAQIRLLRLFSADALSIVVVNDVKPFADASNWMNANAANRVSEICISQGVAELRFPQHLHRKRLRPPRLSMPSRRTGEAINFGYSHLRDSADAVAVIDSDMFPIRRFSFQDMLDGADLAGIAQRRTAVRGLLQVNYLWNGFLLLNNRKLPARSQIDFGCGFVSGVRTDTGGKLHYYLRRHPELEVRELSHTASGTWAGFQGSEYVPDWLRAFIESDPCNANGSFFSELYADSFFHFRSGGNWQAIQGEKPDRYRERFDSFLSCLDRAQHLFTN